jgi:hypothetical protein
MNGVTIVTRDIYNKGINKNATDKQLLNVSRVSVVIVSLCGIAGALWLPILVPLWVLAQALALSGLLAAVVSAWWWKRATSAGALASIICGGVSSIGWAMYAWASTGSPGNLVYGLHAAHVGLIVSVPIMIIVSLATKADYSKVEATSYKALGKAVRQASIDSGFNEKPGFFGFLGAEKGYVKAAWVLVVVLFLLHYILVFGFSNPAFGAFTIWTAITVSIGLMIVIGVMGAVDLKYFLRPAKKDEKLSA